MFSKRVLNFITCLVAGIFLTGCAAKHSGSITLASVFSDGAVLQRNMPLPVWGKASPRSRVICTLGSKSAVTVADAEGNFKLYLPAQPEATGLELIAEDMNTGKKAVSKNIAVGEVYIVAGQSNMAFKSKGTPGWEEEKRFTGNPQIRFFPVPVTKYPGVQMSIDSAWQDSGVSNAENFSAIGYYFAKKMHKQLGGNVPVGVIGIYLGGAAAETFISREALLQNPDFAAETRLMDCRNYSAELYKKLPLDQVLPDGNARLEKGIFAMFPKIPENTGEKSSWHQPDFDDSKWEKMLLPDSWTVAGYNHAGVFWFRKEVHLPESWAGRELTLNIGAADKSDETYFNGVRVGATGDFRKFDHFMSERSYTVPGKLVKPGRNVIAVRVASAASIATDGGLTGPAESMKLILNNREIPLAGEWKLKCEYNFGTMGMEFMRQLGPGAPQTLHMLYDNMVHPLIPYAVRGVVWYQGEANAICMADSYENLLLSLIKDWKTRWGQDEFDFIIIQLPGYQPVRNYQHHSQWAKLREAQRQAALKSTSSLIVTLHNGDVYDIHPANKRPVAERAAAVAVKNITGKKTWQSPMPQKCVRNGNSVVVTFDKDIVTASGKAKTLMVSGKDGVFHPAAGRIVNGNELHITSQVSEPAAVRYAWSNNPRHANIISASDGTLISPFETAVSAK